MTRADENPAVGDVFAAPLGDGRFGLCRIIAAERPRGTWDRSGRWRVVTCAWVGRRLDIEVALRSPDAVAAIVFQRGYGTPIQSISGPPPSQFTHVGHVPPSAADRRRRSPRSPGAWVWVVSQLQAEMTFRADPEGWRAREREQTQERRRQRAKELAEARARQKAMRGRPLAERDLRALSRLSRTSSLASWRGHHPPPFVRQVRACIADLARSLAQAPPPRVSGVVVAVRRTVVAINGLDARWQRRVATPDAEDIVALLVSIGIAAGLDQDRAADVIDQARDF